MIGRGKKSTWAGWGRIAEWRDTERKRCTTVGAYYSIRCEGVCHHCDVMPSQVPIPTSGPTFKGNRGHGLGRPLLAWTGPAFAQQKNLDEKINSGTE